MVERHEPAVDLGADAGVADLGVHGVGEVDRRRPDRQRHDATLRREHEDLVLLEVGLQALHELRRVGDLGLPVDDAVQPVDVVGRRAVLVGPVGGDAPLRPLVHLAGPDLHLDGLAVGPDDRRVQALVEVELGHRDVVLEAAHHRPPAPVDAPERGVAVLHRVDDHAHRHEVEDVVELAPLDDHLLVEAPEVLATPGDLGIDAELGEPAAHLGDGGGQVHLALGRAAADEVVELGEALRVQGGEGEVLELLLDLLHAQAVGQRGVDVQRLLGDALLLGERHRGDRAHVVQPVGQLDDEHPQVARHGDEHLAHRGGLLGLPRVELDALELGDTVDDGGDLVTEVGLHVGQRDLGVLDGVVQQRSGHRDLVEADVGDDAGDRQRVVDVALAARAQLAAMGLGGDLVGAVDGGDGRLGVAPPVAGEQRRQLDGRCRLVVPPPGQDSIDGAHGAPSTSPGPRGDDPRTRPGPRARRSR